MGKSDNRDRLNEIGVLRRREVEVRLLAPLLDALSREFGGERIREITREVIVQLAETQGREMAEAAGGNSLSDFAGALDAWRRDDAMSIEVLSETPAEFSFNVTRCRYAELYQSLGVPELGAILSCNRDSALMKGFNPQVELTRTQTLMEGASHCDFRYRRRSS